MKIISTIGYVAGCLTMAAVVGECLRRNTSFLSFKMPIRLFKLPSSDLWCFSFRLAIPTHSTIFRIRKINDGCQRFFSSMGPSCCLNPIHNFWGHLILANPFQSPLLPSPHPPWFLPICVLSNWSSPIHPISGRAPFVVSQKLIVKNWCHNTYQHLPVCIEIYAL